MLEPYNNHFISIYANFMNNLLSFPTTYQNTAIILNGQVEALTHLKENWTNYQLIIICDGAWQNIAPMMLEDSLINTPNNQSTINTPNMPNMIVIGDGDSITDRPSNFIYDDDQYSTDFEKAIKWLINNQQTQGTKPKLAVDVFWANGGQLDHTLGNLAVACKYATSVCCHFYTDSQYYRYLEDDVCIQGANGKTVSIFPYPDYYVKSSEGFAYPMVNYSMNVDTQQSLRNRIHADFATLKAEGGCFVFVEL